MRGFCVFARPSAVPASQMRAQSSGDYGKMLNDQNVADLVKRIEQTGFKDVHVVPQMLSWPSSPTVLR